MLFHDRALIVCMLAAGALLCAPAASSAQTGGIREPVRYIGEARAFPPAHDGQLRPAVGVESFQVTRANRSHPELADKFGWTYNHAPMIAYWNGRFYVEYLSNPVGEHIAPGQTFLSTSVDGRRWDPPQVVFPIYKLLPPDPPGTAMMHQRMGFYIAPDQRLLAMAFYGHAPDPFGPGGIGRVVRGDPQGWQLRPDLLSCATTPVPAGTSATRDFRITKPRRTPASSKPATHFSTTGSCASSSGKKRSCSRAISSR